MKVAIDIRSLKFAKTGLKTYLVELIKAWEKLPDSNIILLEPDSQPYNGHNKWLKVLEHLSFFWWKQVELPRLAIKNNCTHVFCADFFVPLKFGRKTKQLKTIAVLHDAFFWESPEHYNFLWLKMFHYIGVPAAKQADLIIVPSNYTLERILHFEKFDSNKIIVVPEAAKSLPIQLAPAELVRQLHPDLVPQKYFLHVGVFEKRKNITCLIEAFASINSTHPDFKLVLVGNKSSKQKLDDDSAIQATIQNLNLEHSVIKLGYLEAEVLTSIYQAAFAYVFPSLNEGFGIPVLEAFNTGLPLICSNNAALPEVAGDAALYFDPRNQQTLLDQMNLLLSNPTLKADLIQKGKARATIFSWDKAAIATQKAIETMA